MQLRFHRYSRAGVLVAGLFLIAQSASGQALPALSTLGAAAYANKSLREWGKDASGALDRLRSAAISDANIVAMQRITQADLAAQSLLATASKDLDNKIARVDVTIQRSIDRIAGLTVDLDRIVGDGFDRFALQSDLLLSDACLNLAPICAERYSLSSIRGTVVIPPINQSHTVLIAGPALSTKNPKISAYVDQRPIPSANISRTGTRGEYTARIPASFLTAANDIIRRPEFRVVIADTVPNQNRTPLSLWRPREVFDTLVDIHLPLIVLPARPIELELTERFDTTKIVACPPTQPCQASYEGHTGYKRLSKHESTISDSMTLVSVQAFPRSLSNPTKDHLYIFHCTLPKEIRNEMGHLAVTVSCIDTAVWNGSYRTLIGELFNNPEKRDLLLAQSSREGNGEDTKTSRPVNYTVTLARVQSERISRSLVLDSTTVRGVQPVAVTYGTYRSVPLRSSTSGAQALVTQRYGGVRGQTKSVVLDGDPIVLEGGTTVTLRRIKNGSEFLAELVVTPPTEVRATTGRK